MINSISLKEIIIDVVTQYKRISIPYLVREIKSYYSAAHSENLIREIVQNMLTHGDFILNKTMELELPKKIVEYDQELLEDVCVICKCNEKTLRDNLINTKIDILLKKIKIEPFSGYVLGEITLCIWCQAPLYAELTKLDGRFDAAAEILAKTREQVSILNKILG